MCSRISSRLKKKQKGKLINISGRADIESRVIAFCSCPATKKTAGLNTAVTGSVGPVAGTPFRPSLINHVPLFLWLCKACETDEKSIPERPKTPTPRPPQPNCEANLKQKRPMSKKAWDPCGTGPNMSSFGCFS